MCFVWYKLKKMHNSKVRAVKVLENKNYTDFRSFRWLEKYGSKVYKLGKLEKALNYMVTDFSPVI